MRATAGGKAAGSQRRACGPTSRLVAAVSRAGGGGLIMPGDAGGGGGRPGQRPPGFGPSTSIAAPPGGPLYQPFRPPAAYTDTARVPKAELMNKLSTRSGFWFDQAKALDTLHSMGVTSTDVSDVTGITPLEQNGLKVQAAVYFSLVASPDFPSARLAHFHNETAAATLAELRYTPAAWRPSAALFVAERDLDVGGARELARAIVDAERRKGEDAQAYFEPTPGDALAAKIWNDAGEVPRRAGWAEQVEKVVARGLSVATSEKAKARLRSRLGTPEAPAGAPVADASPPTVQVIRLETEESAFRPLPLIGSLEEATPTALALAPQAATEGVFHAFRPQAAGGTARTQWVSLPAWAKMGAAPAAVAVAVADTRSLAHIPSLNAAPGPALLVIDRDDRAPAPNSYYLVSRPAGAAGGGGGRAAAGGGGGGLLLMPAPGKAGAAPTGGGGGGGGGGASRSEILSGSAAAAGAASGLVVLGRLLLACRPPPPTPVTPRNLPPGLLDLGDAGPAGDGDGMDVDVAEEHAGDE